MRYDTAKVLSDTSPDVKHAAFRATFVFAETSALVHAAIQYEIHSGTILLSDTQSCCARHVLLRRTRMSLASARPLMRAVQLQASRRTPSSAAADNVRRALASSPARTSASTRVA